MDTEAPAAFTVGVVEGFYGRPWTLDQREKLFSRLRDWGMTSYMYAPKDDIKHRAEWRELYTASEAAGIGRLIKACKRNNIDFIYAISPGLDIAYSDLDELDTLTAKVDQVVSLGCRAFALLFDDIESDLQPQDKATFKTFANCQVHIANKLYNHLNKPSPFLFCPTEYCASRAEPSVSKSSYLDTLGRKLEPGIDVLWTGPKVVSHSISVSSIKAIAKVLRRRPLIWDNLHANDYDQRRLFLGPYQSRPSELYPYVSGVLTNPNCEFEANYVAIRTLSLWTQAAQAMFAPRSLNTAQEQSLPSDKQSTGEGGSVPSSQDTDTVEGACRDVHMETTPNSDSTGDKQDNAMVDGGAAMGDNSTEEDMIVPDFERSQCVYDPKAAHHQALTEWLAEFHKPCSFNLNPALACLREDAADTESAVRTEPEASANVPTAEERRGDAEQAMSSSPSASAGAGMSVPFSPRKLPSPSFSLSHLKLLADFFYLPNEYGSQGLHLMEQFKWLRCCFKWYADYQGQSHVDDDGSSSSCGDTASVSAEPSADSNMPVSADNKPDDGAADDTSSPGSASAPHTPMNTDVPSPWSGKESLSKADANSAASDEFASDDDTSPEDKAALAERRHKEWLWHAKDFHDKCRSVLAMFNALSEIPNRPLLYDVYTYIWDVKEIVMMLDEYLTFLQKSKSARKAAAKFYTEDPEPWVFRGGISGDLARFLPEPQYPLSGHGSAGGDKTKSSKSPPTDHSLFTIRPYLPSDQCAMYEVCLKTGDSGQDGTHLFPNHPDLLGHRWVGPYTNLSTDFAYVVEDADGVCGYVLGALDSKFFYNRYRAEWLPAVAKKYSYINADKDLTKSESEVWQDLMSGKTFLPDELYDEYPSHLHIDLLPRIQGKGFGKRMIRCLLKALRSKGSRGVHLEMSDTNDRAHGFYMKVGFAAAELSTDVPSGSRILCLDL